MGSHQSRLEGQTPLNLLVTLLLVQLRMLLAFWAASAHCWLMSSFSPTSAPKSSLAGLLSSPSSPQPVLIPGVAPTQMQDVVHVLVEPHEVHTGPPLKPVQVPLAGIPSLRHADHTTQRCVICKLAESGFDAAVITFCLLL